MKQSIWFVLLAICLSGCNSLGTKSLPTYSYFNTFDEKSVTYMRNTPTIDISNLPSQGGRPHQDLFDHEVVVAVSGGGARAAAFALGVMAELENLGRWTSPPRDINALTEIDYFTTVSGGGWGVAAYLSDRKRTSQDSYKLSERLNTLQKDFVSFSKGDIKCLSNELNEHISKGMTFGDIFTQQDRPELPYLFSVGTVLPSQSPFVFTKDYLEYYEIDHLYACGTAVNFDASDGFAKLDVAYAIATSGSVPAFYHSSATTKICDTDSDLWDSSFCSKGEAKYSKMILADGGVYDNYGYLTALEILNELNSNEKTKKVLIVIDANADTESHFVDKITNDSISVGTDTFITLGFPARTSTFNRMLKPVSEAMGIDSLVIDFFSVADFVNKSHSLGDKNVLEGLTALQDYANMNIACFADDGRYLRVNKTWKDRVLFRDPQADTQHERNISQDCVENNFYRAGLSNKTTYLNDDRLFSVLTQVGRLAVRLNADKIYEAVYSQ